MTLIRYVEYFSRGGCVIETREIIRSSQLEQFSKELENIETQYYKTKEPGIYMVKEK